MGSCFSEKVEPESNKFEQIENGNSKAREEYRNSSKSRSCTDVLFLLLMAVFLFGLMCLLIHCAIYGDIFRIINGYDNCGNVCGKKNSKINDPNGTFACHGTDLVDKPFLYMSNSTGSLTVMRKQCVADCNSISGYKTFLNRCVPQSGEKVVNKFFSKTGLKNFFQEASEDIHLCWREIVYLCLIALALSIVLMLLLRFFVGIVVWVVLIGVALACIIGTAFLWFLYFRAKNAEADNTSDIDSRKATTYLAFSIIATIVAFCVILLILVMRKRIQLVVQLFREAGKAIAAMPLLLLEPLLTFASVVIVISLWLFFCVLIQGAGFLTYRGPEDLYYDKNLAMKLTRWYNLLAMLWMAQFVIGCQHVIIAGAVSTWYFLRDKSRLGSPILNAMHNLARFHLGSVALGSFLIALLQFIRILLATLQSYLKNKEGKCVQCTLACCQCCLACFERILKYLTRNAYIEVAIYGYSFCKGGRQAFKLLVSNALRVTVINSVGDFVLFLGKVLVLVATILIGIEMLKSKEGVHHVWIPILVVGLFAYFVAHCFMTVYEMAIDTIFICFCEDCEQNDGISKPYYMSTGLMEFVQNSKKALAYLDKSQGKEQAWNRPSTISDKVDK